MTLGEVFTATGFLTGGFVLWWVAREKRLATSGMGWIVAAGLFSGLLGAKLAQFFASGWPVKVPPGVALDPAAGGRSLLGGLVFGWIGVEIAKRRLGIVRGTGDLFALALPAGEAVGRIGCYLNGCCYGTRCDLPWAIYQHGAWRHPAQLYSSVVAGTLFALLCAIRKRVTREGDLFRLYLIGFGISRFALEFVRQPDALWWGLTPMQWFCIDIVAIAVIGLVLTRIRGINIHMGEADGRSA